MTATITRTDFTSVSDQIALAGRRMFDAETALRDARQTTVEAWIVAAAEKLHIAIVEHTRAVVAMTAAASPAAA